MKNLLIYTGPKKKFDNEHSILAKVQIDNIINLGWKKKDIILATDFPYVYKGISSLHIPQNTFYPFDKCSNKILVIIYLIENSFLKKNELYWYHDFDVYQLEQYDENNLGMKNFDLGITPYGYKPEWNLGSIFFKTAAIDIFKLIDEEIRTNRRHDNRCDEYAIRRLMRKQKTVGKRPYKELNITYNFTKRCIQTNFRQAEKPLKAIHFHPWDKDEMMNDTALNIFMYGKNRLKAPLMNQRLIKIFQKNGIK